MKQLGRSAAALATVLALVASQGGPVLPAPAHAPTVEEQRAFAEGLKAYQAGDARAAERAWKAGYSVTRDPAFLVRIGEAQEKAGAPAEAVQSYQQYLRESPDAADRADIQARVDRLAPPAAGRPLIDLDSADGAAASEPEVGVLSKEPTRAAPAAPPAPAAQARDDAREDLVPVVEEEPARSAANKAAWVGAGVTVLMLGVAAFFGASASEHAGDANRLLLHRNEATGMPLDYATYGAEYEDDVRAGKRADRLAKGFLLAAGVTALASTILFILDARTEKPGLAVAATRPGLRLVPTGLLWSF